MNPFICGLRDLCGGIGLGTAKNLRGNQSNLFSYIILTMSIEFLLLEHLFKLKAE
ncbi:MAG: hypothetical protein ACFE94_11005 [Candidatus Hodarchaeota archaeon]